ncbi:MAG: ABC transporter permease subunit, partial [Acidobacteria bacterium]|nr:ABC transporter permease subunit [Acidobacteriota bacterium]
MPVWTSPRPTTSCAVSRGWRQRAGSVPGQDLIEVKNRIGDDNPGRQRSFVNSGHGFGTSHSHEFCRLRRGGGEGRYSILVELNQRRRFIRPELSDQRQPQPVSSALSVAISLTAWVTQARIVRGQVLQAREMTYVEAARSLGVSHSRILWRHIL